MDIPTKKFENLSFGTEHLNLDQNNTNYFEYQYNSNKIKPGDSELHHCANGDYENSKANTLAFEIQKNARDYSKHDATTLKKRFMVPNSNETTDYVQNNGKQTATEKRENRLQSNQKETISSIFKQANDKIKNESVFEIDNDKSVSKKGSIFEIVENIKLQPQKQFNLSIVNSKESSNSIFKSDWPPINQTQNAIFESEKYENREAQLQPSIFDKEKYENRCALSKPLLFDKNDTNKEKQSTTYKHIFNQSGSLIFGGKTSGNLKNPSIFETETRTNQPKPVAEKENVAFKNKYLKQFLKRFCEKNITFEHLVEERREEIGCSFEQIMEDCLNNVLQVILLT